VAQLLWSSLSTPKQLIPAGRLSHFTSGGFYDEVLVQNTSHSVTLADNWVYFDPSASGDIAAGATQNRSAQLQLPSDHDGAGDIKFTVVTDAGNFVKRYDATGAADNSNTQSVTKTSVLAGDIPDLVVGAGSIA